MRNAFMVRPFAIFLSLASVCPAVCPAVRAAVDPPPEAREGIPRTQAQDPVEPTDTTEPTETTDDDRLYLKSARAAQAALSYYGPVDDPEAERRVREIGYRVAQASNFDRFPFSFYLIDMPVPNAFALPGGQIFVTRGMLDLGLDDSMLANLLGHEVAHVVAEHGVRMQRRATLLNVLGQAALLGVMIGVDSEPQPRIDPYGESRKGSLVQGTAASGIVFTELLLRKFSRGFEDEADVEGQRYAAAAGYDPLGSHQLWKLMTERIPTQEQYGYWRTHPFSEQRLRAAAVRARDLQTLDPSSIDAFRIRSQARILAVREELDDDEEEPLAPPDPGIDADPPAPWETRFDLFLERTALDAWPRGRRAEALRWARLERIRDREFERDPIARDYGALVSALEDEIATVRALEADSPLVPRLEAEVAEVREQAAATYPAAAEVWAGGIYQTPFLESFLSSYPQATEAPDAALALAEAYSRTGREVEAVRYFVRARDSASNDSASNDSGPSDSGPSDSRPSDSAPSAPSTTEPTTTDPASERAITGLRNLTAHLDRLVALQELAEDRDPELRALASERLRSAVDSYRAIENGASYLRAYPESEHAPAVRTRLETLARNLYGEIVLYQGVGDHAQALERIQKILEYAPTTAAAEALRQRAVLDDDDSRTG